MRIDGIQDLNALVGGRLGAQLGERTVTSPRRRVFGGPLPLPNLQVAPPTTLVAQRLLLQSEQVTAQLNIANSIAGPGTI